MKTGVNNNGVQWVLTGDREYMCYYYAGDGVTYTKSYQNVSQSFINKLSIEDLIKS